MRENLTTRFFKYVNKTPTCWIWIGSKLKTGYGQINIKNGNKQKNMKAHRLSWELHYGDIPEGMSVCHACDIPACVNPGHLWIGTQQENNADRQRKGRGMKGESQHMHKLTENQVKEIRKLYDLAYRGCSVIAKVFHVDRETIRLIGKREIWKHV